MCAVSLSVCMCGACPCSKLCTCVRLLREYIHKWYINALKLYIYKSHAPYRKTCWHFIIIVPSAALLARSQGVGVGRWERRGTGPPGDIKATPTDITGCYTVGCLLSTATNIHGDGGGGSGDYSNKHSKEIRLHACRNLDCSERNFAWFFLSSRNAILNVRPNMFSLNKSISKHIVDSPRPLELTVLPFLNFTYHGKILVFSE